jgi:hypothetical protein
MTSEPDPDFSAEGAQDWLLAAVIVAFAIVLLLVVSLPFIFGALP